MPQHARSLASGGGMGHPLLPYRMSILSLVKLAFLALLNLPMLQASPLRDYAVWTLAATTEEEGEDPSDPTLWIYLTFALALVLAGGAFAGLTIALMGQDEIYLQVIQTSGDGAERKHAARVLRLLKRGKHWVLVTLLLSNVITNETLPIVLDRSLGGGWPAVLGSTVLIVIFGEIIPQSICVRYGLPIGAWMSAPVLVLMYVMAPVAWPTAKLLDKLLGTDHGTTYKKAGLKTLVTLHKTLGEAGEQLNSDEVTIISAVLDLKDKPVGAIMTPMDDVFVMSADTVLDEKTMNIILSAGYSRIPIHSPDNPLNFIGMLLVKMLITYDPEDCQPVRDFALATLPETRPDTSCLDIVNYFQEGKSHMVLVTEFPGEDCGSLGVVTLEDVIEELIGEEIIDESDVFVDVHKAIRRMAPAPWTRVPRGAVVAEPPPPELNDENAPPGSTNGDAAHPALKRLASHDPSQTANGRKLSGSELSRSPLHTVRLRRSSSAAGGQAHSDAGDYITQRADAPALRDHLKHLGPSNLASRPKSTRYTSVKIKPAATAPPTSHAITADAETAAETAANTAANTAPSVTHPAPLGGGQGEGLLSSAGKDAKDGVVALQAGYGTLSPPTSRQGTGDATTDDSPGTDQVNKGVQVYVESPHGPSRAHSQTHHKPRRLSRNTSSTGAGGAMSPFPPFTPSQHSLQQHLSTAHHSRTASGGQHSKRHHSRTHSASTIDSLQSQDSGRNNGSGSSKLRRPARSGSITENIVEHGGFRKVVLEMSSSSSEPEDGTGRPHTPRDKERDAPRSGEEGGAAGRAKRRRKKRRGGHGHGRGGHEKKEGGPGSGAGSGNGHGDRKEGGERSPLLGRK